MFFARCSGWLQLALTISTIFAPIAFGLPPQTAEQRVLLVDRAALTDQLLQKKAEADVSPALNPFAVEGKENTLLNICLQLTINSGGCTGVLYLELAVNGLVVELKLCGYVVPPTGQVFNSIRITAGVLLDVVVPCQTVGGVACINVAPQTVLSLLPALLATILSLPCTIACRNAAGAVLCSGIANFQTTCGLPCPGCPPTCWNPPSDWTPYTPVNSPQRCYKLFESAPISQSAATTACATAATGAKLVSVHSLDEWNFVKTLWPANKNIWIGMTFPDRGPTSTPPTKCIWSDGTACDYSDPTVPLFQTGSGAWSAGEPNNAYGGEACVEIFGETGKWNDLACDGVVFGYEVRGYICKI